MVGPRAGWGEGGGGEVIRGEGRVSHPLSSHARTFNQGFPGPESSKLSEAQTDRSIQPPAPRSPPPPALPEIGRLLRFPVLPQPPAAPESPAGACRVLAPLP